MSDGIVFDPRAFDPTASGAFDNVGFPFTVGSTRGGLSANQVSASYGVPATGTGVAGQFRRLTLDDPGSGRPLGGKRPHPPSPGRGRTTPPRIADLVLELVEQDSTIGGGMLGGALAYRFFVFLLPFALFLVAGLGIYADTTEQTPSEIVSRSGLTALVASEVAAAASSPSRWAIFIVTLPILVYAAAMLYRAIAIVHAIAWHGSGRSVRLSSKGFAVFGGVFFAQLASW